MAASTSKIELAIRKIFGDSLDGSQSRSYWEETWSEGEGENTGDYDSYYGNGGHGYDDNLAEEPALCDDLLDFGVNSGEVYMIVDEMPQDSLEETEAIEYAGECLSWVFFEARERAKGKGKGKPGKHGKGKSFGKGKGHKGSFGKKPPPPGTFGVYGSYLNHRRALQDARKGRGFDRSGDQRPRLSLEQLQAKSRCHACRQVGHWSRNCPQKGRQRPIATGNQPNAQRPTTAMFFVEPSAQSSGYLTMSGANPTEEQYMSDCQPDGLTQQRFSYFCFSSPSQPPPAPDIGDFLSYLEDGMTFKKFPTPQTTPKSTFCHENKIQTKKVAYLSLDFR